MLNLENDRQDEEMPSLNHSYICLQILRQLLQNERVEPLPELTLDIANGLTPDISIFPKEQIHPNFFRDVPKFQQMPILAIEVISSSQTIEELLEKMLLQYPSVHIEPRSLPIRQVFRQRANRSGVF